MRLCVYGASSSDIDDFYVEKTYELAKELASHDIGMVYGGGAQGLMGAAARGMTSGGGEIIGVSPTFFDVEGVLYKHCTEFIYTETMRERKRIMEEKAYGFIVLPGGIGTFEEFFEILTLKHLKRHNKPIAVFNIKGYYDKLWEAVEYAITEKFLGESTRQLVYIGQDIEGIAEYFKNYDPNTVVKTEKDKYVK